VTRSRLVPACLLFFAFLISVREGRAAEKAPAWRERVESWTAAHQVEIVKDLADLLAIPNLASDQPNIERNASRILAILNRRGIRGELLRVEGAPPVVFGERDTPGAKRTVVFYAHYDGQPVDAKDWFAAPWQPVLREGPIGAGGRDIALESLHPPLDPEWRLYGRSASDDKAPLVGWMAALDALSDAKVPVSVNLKFFLEGEEEAGSPHLAAYLDKYAGRLGSDLWILCDGPVHQSRRMQVFFGARGTTDLEITTYGPTRRLHSGHYGNWAPNPIAALVELLASMRSSDGFIRIAGFDKEVRPLSAAERRALAEVPSVDADLMTALQIGRAEGRGESLTEAIQRPALNFRGIRAGDVGAAATNSIPTEATASIDFRLVPDQTLEAVRASVEAHVRGQGYFIVHDPPDADARRTHPKVARLQWGGAGYPGYRTPMDLPSGRAVVRAVEEAAGGPIVTLPSLGGSIPMSLFAEKLGAPIIGVPIANHDNNQHAANENLRLQNLWDGIRVYAGLFARLGQVWSK
jgi:acetylornithine deacetylase/succinyl-diaminopimelate desuccinylase-like protein